jgi:hypothetical protein
VHHNECLGGLDCSLTCDSVVEGIKCASDSQCPNGTKCGRKSKFCAWGPDVGNVCQETVEGCTDFGNCCSDPTACRASRIAAMGSSAGYHRENNSWPDINTGSTDMVHRFSSCFGASGKASAIQPCQSDTTGMWNIYSATGTSRVGAFSHEMAHSLGAYHDSECSSPGLRIQTNTCTTGPKAGRMCTSPGDCSDPNQPNTTHLCGTLNVRTCDGGPNNGALCADTTPDCEGAPCKGPQNRLCFGGTRNGKVCNASYSGECPGGTCTGAPMNYDIYPMSNSGTWGGFSPCSQKEIGISLDNSPSCLLPLPCGDANRDGTVTSSDALLANRIAVGLDPYNDLANVWPLHSPDTIVSSADGAYILQLSVGLVEDPTQCGTPAFPYRWVNNY